MSTNGSIGEMLYTASICAYYYSCNLVSNTTHTSLTSSDQLYSAYLNTNAQLCIYPYMNTTSLYCTIPINPSTTTIPPYILSFDSSSSTIQITDSNTTAPTVIWSVGNTVTSNALNSLVMDDNSQLKLYDNTNTVVWTSSNVAVATPSVTPVGNVMYSYNIMNETNHDMLVSTDGVFTASLTSNGLCMYNSNNHTNVYWCTTIYGGWPADTLYTLQFTQTQIQIIGPNQYVYWSLAEHPSSPNPLSHLQLDTDSRLRLYDTAGKLIWTSDNAVPTLPPLTLGNTLNVNTMMNSTVNDVLISADGQYTAGFVSTQLCIYNSTNYNTQYWCSTVEHSSAYVGTLYTLVLTDTEVNIIDATHVTVWSVSESSSWPYPLSYVQLDVDSRLKLYNTKSNLIWSSDNPPIYSTPTTTAPTLTTSNTINSVLVNNNISSADDTEWKIIGIVFIVLFGVIVILVTSVITYYWCRKRQHQKKYEQYYETQIVPIHFAAAPQLTVKSNKVSISPIPEPSFIDIE